MSRCFFEPSNRGIVLTGNSNGVFVLQTTVINGNAFNYGVVCEGTGFARNLIGLNIENALRQQILIGGEPGNKRIVISDSWLGAGDDQGPTREGILIQPGIENVLISNCRIGDQRTFGIETQGSYVKIAGNLMENNGWGGILVNGGTNILAQSNIIRGANVGIRVSGTSDYYIISHNLLNDAAIASDGATGTHKIVDSNL
ncbi:MAG: right-handed parallel beta-helix repeat-containing protein [Chloroflexi bacterium]|nr:right-handed parallel beta-helix repeat-containing protein [Chloroflexota bacterium]